MKSGAKSFGLGLLIFVGVLVAMVTICQGQQYPNREIELVVPHGAGGGVDLVFRSIQDDLAKELKVPVIVTNRPGGGSSVGSAIVSKAKPDGYSLLGQEVFSHIIGLIMNPSLPYHPIKDFELIAHIAVGPQILAVKADSEFKTLEDFFAYARKNPGKLMFGTPGVGTSTHLTLELLKTAAGDINITHLPLSGAGEVLTNLLGGHIDCTVISLPPIKPHIKAGKIRPLVTLQAESIPSFPEIPTAKQKGLVGVDMTTELGLLGPKGLPPEVIKELVRAMNSILKSPQVIEKLNSVEYRPGYLTRDQFREYLEKNLNRFIEVARRAGISKI